MVCLSRLFVNVVFEDWLDRDDCPIPGGLIGTLGLARR